MKIDYLAIGSHPDDCEFFVSGTLMMLKKKGYTIGICDLSKGEAGTLGDEKKRKKETENATKTLQLDKRITLDLPDGNIRNNEASRKKIIKVIRTYQPQALISFGGSLIRHPDHYYTGQMIQECFFLSGLQKINIKDTKAHKPKTLFQFNEFFSTQRPDFIIDITPVWEKKLEAIKCYQSQVFTEKDEKQPSKTFIKSTHFWQLLISKSKYFGSLIGVPYAEGFFFNAPLKIEDPLAHIEKK